MEFWSYTSGGNRPVCNEIISGSDSLSRSKNGLSSWEMTTNQCSIGNSNMLDHQAFGELGLQELIEKELPDNGSVRNDLSCVKRDNPFIASSVVFSREDDSTSKLSSSVVDSNSRDSSSLIDLKLGRFGDHRGCHKSQFPKVAPVLSSFDLSTPRKRSRVASLNFHTAYCQVYGCNKDLSSSKEYHKRHKVCEVHSKTSKVIVNGIEQRFCQQCSRFHLLDAFDDGKRSCRKRLADHNERRRKPQVGINNGKAGALLQSYNGFAGQRFEGSMSNDTSFIFQDILSSGILHPENHGRNSWCKRIKVKDNIDYTSLQAIPTAYEHLRLKPLAPPDDYENLLPSFHDNESNIASGSIFNGNSTQFSHDFGGPNPVSRSIFQDASHDNEDFNFCATASTIQGLSGISDSGCALSLLSSQSHNSSSHSSRNPTVSPLVFPANHTQYSMSQVSEKLNGENSQVSTKFSLSGVNSSEGNLMGPILIPDDGDVVNFDITNNMYGRLNPLNAKNHLSCEDGPTIDLLQLSSQLQRVEYQRHSMQQVNQKKDAFCCHRIT